MSEDIHSMMASDMANVLEVVELSEFVKDRLYFMVLSSQDDPRSLQTLKDWKESLDDPNSVYYLSVDKHFVYEPFFCDFGPLNLAMIYRYIGMVQSKLKVYKKVVHVSHKGDPKKKSNSALLISAYMLIEENWTPHQTYSTLSQQNRYQYLPFRDASCLLQSDQSVTVEECINALYKAKWFRFFDFNDFDPDKYEKYETVEFGDINWIIPNTFLAFSSPHYTEYVDRTGYPIHAPGYYFKYFKKNNVKHVVRLNSKMYDAQRTFVAVANIQHTDLIFTDGTPPTANILYNFFAVCEQYIDENPKGVPTDNEITESNVNTTNTNINGEDGTFKCAGAVAVHCKAGLGRTGCLIASYIIKHWPFTATEAIAWIRICRPGSVIGTQQQWLMEKEEYLRTCGKQWREERKYAVDKYKRFTYGVYSLQKEKSKINNYEYVDPPLQSSISNKESLSRSISDGGKTKNKTQNRLSSVLKKKLKSNIQALPNAQNDVNVPNLRQRRSASKNEEPKLNNTISLVKKKSTNSATKSLSKGSTVGKKNTKITTLNKIGNRLTRRSKPTEITTKTNNESIPSYALATVASSARVTRRLSRQNSTTK